MFVGIFVGMPARTLEAVPRSRVVMNGKTEQYYIISCDLFPSVILDHKILFDGPRWIQWSSALPGPPLLLTAAW
jgi:hypothetical protein